MQLGTALMAPRSVLVLLFITLILLVLELEAQTDYTITSFSSEVSFGTETLYSCSVHVVENVEYAFHGSYSTVSRAVPYGVADDIPSSLVKVEVLTPNYNVSSTSIDPKKFSFDIVSTFYPATPSGVTTTIKIRRSYIAKGPVTRDDKQHNVVTYYYKEACDVSNLNVSFVFDSSLNLNSNNLTAMSGGLVYGTTVMFYKSFSSSNDEFIPYVTFPIRSQFSSCAAPTTLVALILVIVACVLAVVTTAVIINVAYIKIFLKVGEKASEGRNLLEH
ncbi:hypothetical protein C9374_009502 [Naegleria lovaniensis]|uniref:Uncharacterized protein n=1 Tax=Naegleria lovaniensis TaxID=51637 RepID=A0AA88H156_NAELO|nr:uncharacterized protein C9374_009502 [Naegleria lovaniensis]KAG2392925.1 hypothetical protein C9374_009502 [Naegleria lovaniensis]